MTETLSTEVTKQPEPEVEIEEIDLSELEEDYLEYYGGEQEEEDLGEYYVEEESDRSSPPSTGDLGVFEIYEGFEYTPYDNNGKFISPTSELNDPDCDILYDEALLDREDEERYELLTWNKPEPEQFKYFEDYKNAKWGYDSTTYMSGTEQAFQIWNQISPIAYRNDRWVVPSTSGKNSKVYDFRWAFACKTSFADLPETRVYTANQLSDEAGIPTKTLKKMMKYTPDSPFVQISDRYFMSINDLKLIIEHHPEVFAWFLAISSGKIELEFSKSKIYN